MNYASYLQLNQLLSLQQPESPSSEHRNENLFIITHQTYELWFKQLIDELHIAISLIEERNMAVAIETMTRINAITQTVVNQISVICTLKFHEFQRFREYLGTSSGFQSYQFAGIEALLGKANNNKIQQYQYDLETTQRLESIIKPVSLWDTMRRHLILMTDKTDHTAQNVQEVIKDALERPGYESIILNQMLDLDSLMQEWRYRHVKLVERTIGQRKGSGGSSGADFLKSTIFTPCFDELWDAIS